MVSMANSDVRALLRETIRTDTDLDTFCQNYFPEVYRKFVGSMLRTAKENVLIESIQEAVLQAKLSEERAEREVLSGPTSYGAALGAALRLDRTTQWQSIVESSRAPETVLFLLHGQRERAGLSFFLDRIFRFLAPEHGERQRIFKVPFLNDGVGIRTGEDWMARVQTELADRLGRRGATDLREMLRLATARQPFFVLLGRFPLPMLSEAELLGLEELLTTQLPDMLMGISHVRVLLAHDYDKPSESQAKKMEESARKGAKAGKYKFMPLDEAVLPSWKDVVKYLSDHKQVSEQRIAALKPEYERLRSRKTVRYEDLATFLDRKLDT